MGPPMINDQCLYNGKMIDFRNQIERGLPSPAVRRLAGPVPFSNEFGPFVARDVCNIHSKYKPLLWCSKKLVTSYNWSNTGNYEKL